MSKRMSELEISPQTLYRLPWSLTDNAIAWLEPTSKCNLYCDGCYRENREGSHKSIDEIKHELDVFERLRITGGVSIAGGEPLMHPDIVEIVSLIKQKGWKPIINSNGALISKELLKELKKAGVISFTFHVDSHQQRPHWKDKNELELCELRLELAEMLAEAGGIACSFNATVYPDTLQYIPELTKWAQRHIDKIHIMVYIIYRIAQRNDKFDYFVGGKKIPLDDITYSRDIEERRTDITSLEVVDEIRKEYPDFMPCAYLNGTANPDSYKWLLTGRFGNKHEIFGYMGPKFMEAYQSFHHLFKGSYSAYEKPTMLNHARWMFALCFMDKGTRKAAKNYFRAFMSNPKAFFNSVHFQSIMTIQPIDFLENGELNMCDGCPDMTVWNDKLVWSCRMEEQYLYGQNVTVAPKQGDLL